MNLVAVYNRQPAIRNSGLLRSAKPDRFLARFSHKYPSRRIPGFQIELGCGLTILVSRNQDSSNA